MADLFSRYRYTQGNRTFPIVDEAVIKSVDFTKIAITILEFRWHVMSYKLAIVLICFVFSSLCENQTESGCLFGNGQAPSSGQCEGPLSRVFAKRNHIEFINRGCKMHQIFFADPNYLTSNSSFEQTSRTLGIKCGECIPGTNGNIGILDRLLSYESQLSIQLCKSAGYNQVECSTTSQPFAYQCPFNQFCTSEGTCKPLSMHPLYNQPCRIASDLLQFGSTNDRLCGGEGLSCIQGTCQVCYERSWLRPFASYFHLFRSQSNTISSVRNWTLVSLDALCVSGQLEVSNWARMIAGLQDPELMLLVLLGSTFSIIGILRKCFTFSQLWQSKRNK